MIFVLNELSLEGQFTDISTFQHSIKDIMIIKNKLYHYGYDLKIKRDFKDRYVISNSTNVIQAIKQLSPDQKRSIMSWITTCGPFWDDNTQHCLHDNIICNTNNIVGSALAEAGYYCYLGEQTSSVSFSPSTWNYTPIIITIEGSNQNIDNFWKNDDLDSYLKGILPEPTSWKELENNSKKCFSEITFLEDAFSYLDKEPFSKHVSKEILFLLGVLNELKSNFDDNGKPNENNEKWNEIHKNFFVSATPRFSDSSEREKNEFKKELCFCDPITKKHDLFCPWHGKIHSPQIRIHFTFPIKKQQPLYVAYIGPKITKQ